MKYRVHIFATVRVPVDVEAESQLEAVNEALAEYRDSHSCPTSWDGAEVTGDLVNEFLVDEFSDVNEWGDQDWDYDKGRWYWFDKGDLELIPANASSQIV